MDRIRFDFSRPERFFVWLAGVQQKDRTTWVFAHGLGYCLTLLDFWQRLGTVDEKYLWAVLEDPPTIICCRRGRRLIKYVDVQNYWRVPLTELSGAVVDSEAAVIATDSPVSLDPDIPRRKVQIIEELICRAINLTSTKIHCSWQCTAASLAWHTYRNGFLDSSIWVHGHTEASKLERSALFGGRLQMYRSGFVSTPTYALDVQSLYPAIMASKELPNKLVSYQEEASLRELRDSLQGYHVVAEVALRAPHPHFPYRRSGLVSYPDAAGVFTLTAGELALAFDSGMVASCGQLARYERANLFSRFVSHFYQAKVTAQAAGLTSDVLLYKMILNGLSGKFAQTRRGWIDDKKVLCPDNWCYWWQIPCDGLRPIRYRAIGGRAQRLQEGGETRNSFPAITAAITSWGRAELDRLVGVAGADSTIYTDTDCLHVTDAGYSRLSLFGEIAPGQLGRLREVARGKDAYYWGPKHYRLGEFWVSNVIQMTAQSVADGVWLQESKRGLEQTFQHGTLDRVLVKDIQVKVGTGPGAYRPDHSRS